eukprot:Plantae.Rhodophyta-Palmaria_palmata.ctg22048.p2 GENE.Plantae.Rhodophyta-Palmaria_palmata.ctg22048~~Plantae.Rhodophyta-Palmaria_palmata.ctg22048.p2  ORF type:complete len:165 (-),score=43.59 Plantae.Rhodophyta-Palmaria_palmata.ctg22048:113-565(-)
METAASHDDWFDGPLFFAQLSDVVNSQTKLFELYLEKGSFFGHKASQEFIDQHIDLLKDLYEDPNNEDFAALTAGIESVTILDGKIVIKPRRYNVMTASIMKEKSVEYVLPPPLPSTLQNEEDPRDEYAPPLMTEKVMIERAAKVRAASP